MIVAFLFRIPIANIFVSRRRRKRSVFEHQEHRRIARQTTVNATNTRRQILVPVVAGNSNSNANRPRSSSVDLNRLANSAGITNVPSNTLDPADFDYEDVDTSRLATLVTSESTTEPGVTTSTTTEAEIDEDYYEDYADYYEDEEDADDPLEWVTFDDLKAQKEKSECQRSLMNPE